MRRQFADSIFIAAMPSVFYRDEGWCSVGLGLGTARNRDEPGSSHGGIKEPAKSRRRPAKPSAARRSWRRRASRFAALLLEPTPRTSSSSLSQPGLGSTPTQRRVIGLLPSEMAIPLDLDPSRATRLQPSARSTLYRTRADYPCSYQKCSSFPAERRWPERFFENWDERSSFSSRALFDSRT